MNSDVPEVCLYLMLRGIYGRERLVSVGCRSVKNARGLAVRAPEMVEAAETRIEELYADSKPHLEKIHDRYQDLLQLNPKLSTSMDWDVPSKLFKEGEIRRALRSFG